MNGSKAPRWLHALIPSVTDVIFLVIFVGMVRGDLSSLLEDGDTGWHIRNGEIILRQLSVPTSDGFSYTMSGKPWYAWEWLADILFAALHKAWGLNGVVVCSALVIGLTFTLWLKLLITRTKNVVLAFVLALLSLVASTVHWLARPHIFSWLLVLLWYIALERLHSGSDEEEPQGLRPKYVAFFAGSMLLWVNLHGGFVAGLVLVGIYLTGNAIVYFTTEDAKQKQRSLRLGRYLLAIFFVCSLVTLANPYGYNLHIHIYRYLSNSFIVNHVNEWASPNFHELGGRLLELLILMVMVAIALRRQRPGYSHLLLIVFWTHLTLYSARNIPLFVLLVVPILAVYVVELMRRGEEGGLPGPIKGFLAELNRFSSDMTEIELKPRFHLLPVLAVVLGFYACAHRGQLAGRQAVQAEFDAGKFPVAAASFMETQKLAGNLFSSDYWGGYLIYRFYPERKVFVDGRSDFYGDAFLKQYLEVLTLRWNR